VNLVDGAGLARDGGDGDQMPHAQLGLVSSGIDLISRRFFIARQSREKPSARLVRSSRSGRAATQIALLDRDGPTATPRFVVDHVKRMPELAGYDARHLCKRGDAPLGFHQLTRALIGKAEHRPRCSTRCSGRILRRCA